MFHEARFCATEIGWLVWRSGCVCVLFEVFRFDENEQKINFQMPETLEIRLCELKHVRNDAVEAHITTPYVRLSRIYHFITCLICLPVENTMLHYQSDYVPATYTHMNAM